MHYYAQTNTSFNKTANLFMPSPFGLKALSITIDGVSISQAQEDMSDHQLQSSLFVGVVLRDAYRFLMSPDDLKNKNDAFPGTVLLGRKSNPSGDYDEFAFVEPTITVFDRWELLDNATMLSALDHLGELNPMSLCATRAFEKYLARKVATWDYALFRGLSVEFLIAFGRELGPRYDIQVRIRSDKLNDDDLLTLSNQPFAAYVNQDVLNRYQHHIKK